MDGAAIVIVGVVGGGDSVLVSPRDGYGGGIGPGVLGSASELPLNATVSAPMARTLVAPAVAAASFNLVLFTLDHSNRFNSENAYEEVSGNPFEVRVTELSDGQTLPRELLRVCVGRLACIQGRRAPDRRYGLRDGRSGRRRRLGSGRADVHDVGISLVRPAHRHQ